MKSKNLKRENIVKNEIELEKEIGSFHPIVEGIFSMEGNENKLCSIEVKRIFSFDLPKKKFPRDSDLACGKYKKGYPYWGWWRMVKSAIMKVSPFFVNKYNIKIHYVVIVLPEKMDIKDKKKIKKNTLRETKVLFENIKMPVPVEISFIDAPDLAFD